MTNAELFKKIFGIYSEEFWSYTEKQMLEWINADVPDTNIGDTISRQAAIDALKEVSEHYTDKGREWHPHVDFMVDAIKELPSAQRKGKWYPIGNTGLAACECGYITDRYSVYNYCPKCGAWMKGEEDVRKSD